MKFILKHWHTISLFAGIYIIAGTLDFWDSLTYLQVLSLLNLGVIFLHFYEEFGFPGGFPKFANTLFNPKDSTPDLADRYPLNAMSALWINWGTALFLYLPPVLFPDVIGLGLAPMLFGGVAQVIVHGIVNNKILKTWYNSGLATSVLGHLPLLILYIQHIENQNLATIWDYVIGMILMIVWYVIVIRILIPKLWESKNSPYPFSKEVMDKFDKLYKRK